MEVLKFSNIGKYCVVDVANRLIMKIQKTRTNGTQITHTCSSVIYQSDSSGNSLHLHLGRHSSE